MASKGTMKVPAPKVKMPKMAVPKVPSSIPATPAGPKLSPFSGGLKGYAAASKLTLTKQPKVL